MISKDMEENKEKLIELFNNTSDLIIHKFHTLGDSEALVAYIDMTIDKKTLDEYILQPLIRDLISPYDIKSTVYIAESKIIYSVEDGASSITNGNVALFMEDLDYGYIFDISQWQKRQVEQPTSEMVIRGPKEAFIENIFTNKSLLRYKIRNKDLIFEDYIVGQDTNSIISLGYIKGIVREDVLEEIRTRIKAIEISGILDSGQLEEFLVDTPSRLIRTIAFTEKPDVASSKILEGKVIILCDGSPNVLTVPKIFVENLHSPEDYYINAKLATFLRILRLGSFFFSFAIPGIYIALILFHQEMIPTRLLISIAKQREGVPLAAPLEALVMILFFELFKESGIRLPEAIGQAVTLVGGLVIGQAAVDAGVISAAMLIIIAASGMTEFVIPKLREMVSIYRLTFLFLGSIAGLYGIAYGLVFMIIYFISIDSFGIPFMWPIAPYNKEGMRDAIIKQPSRKLKQRPKVTVERKKYIRDDKNG